MSSKPKSQRQLQVNERVKRAMAEIFSNSGLTTIMGGYVTILEADSSPDMKNCKIFLNIFGADDKKTQILERLNGAAPRMRAELGKELTMRSTPEIRFVFDESAQNAIAMDGLLSKESKNFTNND